MDQKDKKMHIKAHEIMCNLEITDMDLTSFLHMCENYDVFKVHHSKTSWWKEDTYMVDSKTLIGINSSSFNALMNQAKLDVNNELIVVTSLIIFSLIVTLSILLFSV